MPFDDSFATYRRWGWYINEFRDGHNHHLMSTCAEKVHFPSHRHIDQYTREMVSQLRQNKWPITKMTKAILKQSFSRLLEFFSLISRLMMDSADLSTRLPFMPRVVFMKEIDGSAKVVSTPLRLWLPAGMPKTI
jgi:hypothetical protein